MNKHFYNINPTSFRGILFGVCLLWAIFKFGKMYGLMLVEEMLGVQMRGLSEGNLFPKTPFPYSDAVVKFIVIALCFMINFALFRRVRGKFFEIISFPLISVSIYVTICFIFFTGRGALPGQQEPFRPPLYEAIIYLDLVFLGIQFVLLGVSLCKAWKLFRSDKSFESAR